MGDNVVDAPQGKECSIVIQESTVASADDEDELEEGDGKIVADGTFKPGVRYRINVLNFEGGGIILSVNEGHLEGQVRHGKRCPTSRSFFNPSDQEERGSDEIPFHWTAPPHAHEAIFIATCSAYYGGPNYQSTRVLQPVGGVGIAP